ncbi:MAG: CoA transferase [Bosea sp.]|jgi:crotonobetainyl-CoA:carnitine CoA-transferase CaiB-like acyl-CoA transferase|uniref:CaiB/BaiF CoA transferase family protein n=1 Tax=Bosea sp. (in: a-proteobacteria) TaxID=1871050 RepID=UPI001AC6C11D|nr:CaiB/BaiF CoA-transferase family protein [Bosea sp. (in: a-proteobacteria)]MBN9469356.1 CoA transferase [Bosea sp. (in: a-proteobacteria)]
MIGVEQATVTPGPLSHLKVLDLSRVLAGPWAGQALGDLGADVIKVEAPQGGDDTRKWGPPFLDGPDNTRDAAYFTACNRNKRSVTIDFARPEGAALVRRLAARCDVVIENFKVGGLVKYGLDHESLRSGDPRLIYCSITGFGQTGPYAHRAGYDFLVQGMGGLMSVTGQADGLPGAAPMKVGVAVSDLFTGMYAVSAILAALIHRDRTGEGQHIDCALLDCQVAMLANQGANWLAGGAVPTRMGNNHPNVVPYRVYPVVDGHVIVACGNDGQFRKLSAALGSPGLADDPRYATNEARVRNRAAIDDELTTLLAGLMRDEAIMRLERAGVPCGPINTLPDVFADPHVKARNLEIVLERSDGTGVNGVAFPARLSATPATFRAAPPLLGQHTEAVLGEELGLDSSAFACLRAQGVI